MATNKEHFETLESSIGELRDSIQQLFDMVSKKSKHKHHRNLSSSSSSLESTNSDSSVESSDSNSSVQSKRTDCGEDGVKRRLKNPIRLEFPKFLGDDPRVWLDRAQQYFVAQDVHGSKKVSLASFYLDREANQWWRWFAHANCKKEIIWKMF